MPIKKIKDSWTKEEVEQLIKANSDSIIEKLIMNNHEILTGYYIDFTNNWIEQHL